MCNPAAFIGLALSAASAGINAAAQAKVARAREDVLAAERIRQRSYDNEATAFNKTAQDQFKDYNAQQDTRTQALGDYFSKTNVANDPNMAVANVMPSSNSAAVQTEVANQKDKAAAFTGQQAQALAGLRAFGDLFGDKSRETAKAGSAIGQIGNFKRGSSDVVPYELDKAAQAGNGLKIFGDVLGGLGGLASSFGAQGLAAPAAAASGNVATTAGAAGSRALGAALDRASVPGYAGYGAPLFQQGSGLFGWLQRPFGS